MITARDVAPAAPRQASPAASRRRPQPLAVGLLHVTLFVAVLTSGFAMIEPSPHDLLMGGLAFACLVAGVTVERKILPMLLLLMLWNISGLFGLFDAATDRDALQYTAISFYLAIAATLFACIVAQDSVRRMDMLRTAYVLAAVVVSVVGIASYVRIMPGADNFLLYGRVKSTFKDPNVFGPFLILPLLFLIQDIVARGPRLLPTASALAILAALLMSFSRGAWFHFALSAAVMIALMILTAGTQRERVRIIGLSALAVAAMAVVLVALLSVSSLRTMLLERAQLVQSYDVGQGGRFSLQQLALGALLERPFGFGPFEFARIYGLQQHNAYLQAFVVYGWLGGFAYLTLVAMTLIVGLRAALIRAPWQPYLIAAYGAFVGEAAESVIIDTDHWRHYFLILGIVWGLSAASIKAPRPRGAAAPAYR